MNKRGFAIENSKELKAMVKLKMAYLKELLVTQMQKEITLLVIISKGKGWVMEFISMLMDKFTMVKTNF